MAPLPAELPIILVDSTIPPQPGYSLPRGQSTAECPVAPHVMHHCERSIHTPLVHTPLRGQALHLAAVAASRTLSDLHGTTLGLNFIVADLRTGRPGSSFSFIAPP